MYHVSTQKKKKRWNGCKMHLESIKWLLTCFKLLQSFLWSFHNINSSVCLKALSSIVEARFKQLLNSQEYKRFEIYAVKYYQGIDLWLNISI